ncbi:MAG TPA: hypothetical protein VNJ08_06995 [Bacteriovoracaceae bacterium]|nr:hypothetical protein [Bacteriovoracaceae bacterium]
MKIILLTILLILSVPVYCFEEQVLKCITLNANFKPDGGSFNVNLLAKGSTITNIKGNQLLKGFQAESPAKTFLCKNADEICGFSLNLDSKDGPWIEMSSHMNLGKDTSSIIKPEGFFFKVKSLVMKDMAEKEILEAETKDHKLGHVFIFEPATGLDKPKRKLAMRIQCGNR